MCDNNESKLVSFKPDSELYTKLAFKAGERNEPVQAVSYLRKALAIDPRNIDARIMLAQTLNHMNRFYDSLVQLQLIWGIVPDPPPDVIFGMANNYIAIEKFTEAVNWLERYLEYGPEGELAQLAEDYLELLEDEDALGEQLGLADDEDSDLMELLSSAREMHLCRNTNEALSTLREGMADYPNNPRLEQEIALYELLSGDTKDTEQRLFRLLSADHKNVRTRCLMSMLHIMRGNNEQACDLMRGITPTGDTPIYELRSIAAVYLELKQFDMAMKVLDMLKAALPYDEQILHQYGYASYFCGNPEAAKDCYRTLLGIDEHDLIAEYYLAQCSNEPTPDSENQWLNVYVIPPEQALKYCSEFFQEIRKNAEHCKERWESDRKFQDIVRWAFLTQSLECKKMAGFVLNSVGTPEIEYLYREFLLRVDESSEAKALTLMMLKDLGVDVHLPLTMNGQFVMRNARLFEEPDDLPPSYKQMHLLIHTLEKNESLPENFINASDRLLSAYFVALEGKYPQLTVDQRTAIVCAVMVITLGVMASDTDPVFLCEHFKVTPRRLANALDRIFAVLHTELPNTNLREV